MYCEHIYHVLLRNKCYYYFTSLYARDTSHASYYVSTWRMPLTSYTCYKHYVPPSTALANDSYISAASSYKHR